MSQERSSQRIRKWNEVWTAFGEDSPMLQQTLETEFRAALGSYRAKLAILLEYIAILGARWTRNPRLITSCPGPRTYPPKCILIQHHNM